MILTVKKTLHGWTILRENTAAVTVRIPFLHRNTADILDAGRHVLYHIEKNGGTFTVTDRKGATASGSYESADGQPFLFRPAMPVWLHISFPTAAYSLMQQKNRDIILYREGAPIGSLEHMASGTRRTISCTDGSSPELLSALYVLGCFMIHEDDVDIV